MTKREKINLLIKIRKFKNYLIQKFIASYPPLNNVQSKAISTIKRIILKQNSTLLIAPLSGSCYVEYKNYFIKFNSTHATITNSKFSYYVEYDYHHGEKLVNFFNLNVEKRRVLLEDKYNFKTVKNLEEMLKSL